MGSIFRNPHFFHILYLSSIWEILFTQRIGSLLSPNFHSIDKSNNEGPRLDSKKGGKWSLNPYRRQRMMSGNLHGYRWWSPANHPAIHLSVSCPTAITPRDERINRADGIRHCSLSLSPLAWILISQFQIQLTRLFRRTLKNYISIRATLIRPTQL